MTLKVIAGNPDAIVEKHNPARASIVTFEVSILVGHSISDDREAVIAHAKTLWDGVVTEGSEQCFDVDESAEDDFGIDFDDGVDTVAPSLGADDCYSRWRVRDFVDDTEDAAHNRAMAKRQMRLL